MNQHSRKIPNWSRNERQHSLFVSSSLKVGFVTILEWNKVTTQRCFLKVLCSTGIKQRLPGETKIQTLGSVWICVGLGAWQLNQKSQRKWESSCLRRQWILGLSISFISWIIPVFSVLFGQVRLWGMFLLLSAPWELSLNSFLANSACCSHTASWECSSSQWQSQSWTSH